ncbi:MAG: tetratricopeptide repeat protein [Leptospiraceae bacterium]|nr:tetratricopeptide repeat protein [Leptospiraceae bacterium]MDW7976949.1 tetratricopeptide repeat protein [Leptospiraceae bacterium]
MAIENKQEQIQKFLEGLDEYNPDFFFPFNRVLYQDIKPRLLPEDFEKYKKYFHFPTDEPQPQEKKETTPTEDFVSDLYLEETQIPTEEKETDELSLLSELESLKLDEASESLEIQEQEKEQETLQTESLDVPTQELEDQAIPTLQDEFPQEDGMDTLIEPDLSDAASNVADLEVPTFDDIPQPSLDELSPTTPEEPLSFPEDLDLKVDTDIELPDIEPQLQDESLSPPDMSFDVPQMDDLSLVNLDETPKLEDTTPSDFQPLDDLGNIDVNLDDLKEMEKQSLLQTGIGTDYSEEELAKLRQNLLSYSEPLRKAIIDAVVNEKIPRPDQKLLVNMLIEEAEETTIADFLEEKLGYRPKISVDRTKEGIPIIYTEEVSPEALQRRKKRAMIFLLGMLSIFFGVVSFFVGINLFKSLTTKNLYEEGLEILKQAKTLSYGEKLKSIELAESYFQRAVVNQGTYDIDYLNQYGRAYIELGEYDKAFEKLFGKVQPEYFWNSPTQRVPLITRSGPWFDWKEIQQNRYTEFFSDDKIKRLLLIPGGYTVSRLRDQEFHKQNLLELGRFHSLNFPHFLNSEQGKKYKNDELAIDYYRIILTLLDRPNDPEALSGIAYIYYRQRKFNLALSNYQTIVDHYPDNILGHDGILNTYIELWKENQDPRYVVAKHRYLQNLGLEKKLPIYTLTKLAGFYIDLNPEELRVRYNVNPVNALNKETLDDIAVYLLDLAFEKEEKRENQMIKGKEYGEGFYQRGRYYQKNQQYQNAVRQFQYAYYYDPLHYPAVLKIGEYYLFKLEDYERAKEYFLKALETYLQHKDFYGLRPEDETLMHFDSGLIYYYIANVIFQKNKKEFIPSLVSLKEPSQEYEGLLKEFNSAEEYLNKSLENLKTPEKIFDARYQLGFIYYLNGNFDQAIKEWFTLDIRELYDNPYFYYALGNVSLFKEQYNQALNYYKMAEKFFESRTRFNQQESRILYSIYNNLGVTYELIYFENESNFTKRRLDQLKESSLSYYYKAIEFALKENLLPTKAKVNLELSFRRDKDSVLIEDALLPIFPVN